MLLALAIAIAATLLLAFGVMDPAELPLRDFVLRQLPARRANATVIVAIDEASLRAFGPWPWPRATIASIEDRAADAGARGVVIDLLLAQPAAGDDQLARATARVPTLFVSVLDDAGNWLLPPPPLLEHAAAGHGNFELDHDGILRRLASTKQSRDRSMPALSVAAAALLTNAPIPIGRSLAPAFRTPPDAIPRFSAVSFLREGAPVRGRIVFIGPTALALGDRVLAPTSLHRIPNPGVTVHAAATESLVRHEELRTIMPLLGGVVSAVLALVILRRVSTSVRLATAATMAAGLVGGGILLLAAYSFAVPLVTWLMTIIITTAGIETVRMTFTVRELSDQRTNDAESKRVLAHELRTPLASMRTLAQLLGGFELSDAERQRVTMLLETEAGKLQSLVDVLFDLERLPLRPFETSTAVLDLTELVRHRVDFLRASTSRPLSTDTHQSVYVRADAALLERVVDNLVGNALKYTPPDAAITIRVASDSGHAVLDVEDRGPGIAEADRERVFARFFRGRTAAGTRGLGLGLSLVGEIARWHGGTVSLDSPAEGGARFRIRLPLVRGKA
jgi:signal transduction histidine kinase